MDQQQMNELARRIAELERMVFPLDPPYVDQPYQYSDTPCLFSGINPETNQVMGLACPCPRCSAR